MRYEVLVPAETLTQAGIYEVSVYIKGENQENPVLRLRTTIMTPGNTYPQKT
jgi:hypothetical protein